MEVAGAGAQLDCPPDGLVPGTVAGEGTGEYPFNGIQSHPADCGTGGGGGGETERCGGMQRHQQMEQI